MFKDHRWLDHSTVVSRVIKKKKVIEMLVCDEGAPRQSLGRGRQKSIPPQGSGFQKWRPCAVTVLNEFTRSNTLAWQMAGSAFGSSDLALWSIL